MKKVSKTKKVIKKKPVVKKCSHGEPVIPNKHCSGCTDTRSEGTHAGCTIEHGHIGCSLGQSWHKTGRVVAGGQ